MSEIKIDLNGMSLLDVIKAYPEQVLQAIEQHNEEAQKTPTNTASPKLLDKMEVFAKECDKAGNKRDAREVRSWIKQLLADA